MQYPSLSGLDGAPDCGSWRSPDYIYLLSALMLLMSQRRKATGAQAVIFRIDHDGSASRSHELVTRMSISCRFINPGRMMADGSDDHGASNDGDWTSQEEMSFKEVLHEMVGIIDT
jgi:hypothetical protein